MKQESVSLWDLGVGDEAINSWEETIVNSWQNCHARCLVQCFAPGHDNMWRQEELGIEPDDYGTS